ncbi:hypothetical protein [Glycomyces salinus]|uniref:hypothetical protein n=1 Tax=Glycomyces salinus TaxID=980294 RepID=UPI0018EA82A5|nr:hypothetical protein [Glycomyces salinus]
MIEAQPFNGQHPAPVTRRRLSTKATLSWFTAAALVVVSVTAVLIWWQARDSDSLAATGTDCVEDPNRIVDDEAGLGYCIPRDWVQVSEEDMAGEIYAINSSAAEAPGTSEWGVSGWVRFSVVGANVDALSNAEMMVAAFTGADLDSPSIVVEDGVIDGHAATTFSNSHADGSSWMMMTVIEFDDRWVEVWGEVVGDDPHLIEQLESIRESITVA